MSSLTVDVLKWILQIDSSGVTSGAKKADQAVQNLSGTITAGLTRSVVGLAGVYFGAKGLNAMFDATVMGAANEEAAWRRLKTSVDNTGISFDAVKPQFDAIINRMRDLTAYSDDEMIPALQLLVEMTGDYRKAIELLPHVLDLAADRNMTVAEASAFLGRVTDENISRLGRMYPAIRSMVDAYAKLHPEVDKAAYFMQLVNKQTSGAAAKQLEAFTEQVKDLKDNFNEWAESLGEKIIPDLNRLFQILNKPGRDANAEAQLRWRINRLKSDIDKTEKELETHLKSGGFKRFGEALNDIFIEGVNPARSKETIQKRLNELKDQYAKAQAELAAMTAKAAEEPIPTKILGKTKEQIKAEVKAYEDAQKEIFEKASAFEDLYYQLGMRSTEQMIAFYKQQLDIYSKTTDLKKEVAQKLFDYELKLEEEKIVASQRFLETLKEAGRFLLEASIAETEKAMKPGEKFPEAPEKKIYDFWESVNISWERYSEDATLIAVDSIEGMFYALRPLFSDGVNSIIGIVESLRYGDLAGAVSGFISTIMNFFTSGANETREAVERMNHDIDSYISSLDRLTMAQKRMQAEALRLEIERLEEIERTVGINLSSILDPYRRQLNAIMGDLGEFSELKGIKSLQELRAFLTGEGQNLTYERGRNIIDYFTNMLSLSAQDQLALYQMLQRLLGDRLNSSDWMSLNEIIKRLREEGTTGGAGSQIYRSVTTITETQANIMVDVLNTIRLYVSQIVDLMRGASGINLKGYAGMGNGLVFTGPINVYANDPQAFTDSLVSFARSRGFKASS